MLDIDEIELYNQYLFDKACKDPRKKFYRFRAKFSDYFYNGVDFVGEVWYGDKETPCGWWIVDVKGKNRKWVSNTSTKRFAYPTKAEAMNSLLARKKRQIDILKSQLELATNVVSIIQQKPYNSKHEFRHLRNKYSDFA